MTPGGGRFRAITLTTSRSSTVDGRFGRPFDSWASPQRGTPDGQGQESPQYWARDDDRCGEWRGRLLPHPSPFPEGEGTGRYKPASGSRCGIGRTTHRCYGVRERGQDGAGLRVQDFALCEHALQEGLHGEFLRDGDRFVLELDGLLAVWQWAGRGGRSRRSSAYSARLQASSTRNPPRRQNSMASRKW